ncbi:MAG: potassium transporter [Gammaproteobacteria bacterium]|jgi:trk system potassium uptake protein TrkH|nr:potassium transporter [Gammaproteobacteria bacterium]
MNLPVIFRILGVLLMLFSFAMLPPLLVSMYYNDGVAYSFLTTFFLTLLSGFILWAPVMKNRRELKTRDGFLVVTLFWTVLGTFGSFPFIFTSSLQMSVTDSFFESISGLTTTGATVLSGLDDLPKSILYYRQQLQWLGGMGIIAIAVAILPMLGIGGMQLYRAESPGPVKDNKLLPRVTETAKALLFIYISLTMLCAIAYFLAGMTIFDAIGHSFSTVAIGGFSTHDASIGYFDNSIIEVIAIIFMLISGINFALHFFAWQHKSPLHYFQDSEFRFYISMMAVIGLITVLFLFFSDVYNFKDSVFKGLFGVVSIATTTGFSSADFTVWPTFLPFMLFYMAFVGACAGSTGGGIKVIRVILIIKQGFREIAKLIHPNAVIPIKLGNHRVPDRVLESVWGFFSVYVMVYMVMLLACLAVDLDITTAFTAVGASINNLGPGLGDVAQNYGAIPDAAKWILCLGMLLGRLEVFTLLVLFSPHFWRS